VNIQNANGKSKRHQVRQVLKAIAKVKELEAAKRSDAPPILGLEMPMSTNAEKYTYRVMWSEEDQEFVGLCAELHCVSTGSARNASERGTRLQQFRTSRRGGSRRA
jgi:hypothetical protein